MFAVPVVLNAAKLPLSENVPMLPRFSPTSSPGADTAPPLRMFSVPEPELPTRSVLLTVQAEPEPLTVAVPIEPAFRPMAEAPVVVSVAPLMIERLPVPAAPT